MATHEFGIMPEAPLPGKRYNQYEPWKYDCISVDDELIESIIPELESIDFFWHALSFKGMGLAYTGVTLIPPSSLSGFLARINDDPGWKELKELLEKAKKENKWVIHYGL